MPSDNLKLLDTIMGFCVPPLTDEQRNKIIKKYFKYEDNKSVLDICTIVSSLSTKYNEFKNILMGCLNTANSPLKEIALKDNVPLITLGESLTTLRVYQNITLDGYQSDISALSPVLYTPITSLLEKYEKDITNDNSKLKWLSVDRIGKNLLDYREMTTAAAISGNLFGPEVKSSLLRDLAEAIDLSRKPIELVYAEKPEDFSIMYGSGPPSCMAYSSGNAKDWEFMSKLGLCPGSWYAYYPNTKGVYSVKDGKVIARTVLFLENKKWYSGRVYVINSEVDNKFCEALKKENISPLENRHKLSKNLSFTIPGIAQGDTFGCPWPYFDNITRESNIWNISFNKETKIFTIEYVEKGGNMMDRQGKIISSDYSIVLCSTCHKTINFRIAEGSKAINPADDGYTFCSDICANVYGYISVVDGTGAVTYKISTEEQVAIADTALVKFSTLKAAQDNGYRPLIEEIGAYPEDTDVKVYTSGLNIRGSGSEIFQLRSRYNYIISDITVKMLTNIVPIHMLKPRKLVISDFTYGIAAE